LIQFRPFLAQDFDRLIHWLHSAEDVMQFAGSSLQYPVTTLQLQDYLLVHNRIAFVIYYLNIAIGHCAITDVDKSTAMLNHILIGDSSNRNKGIGTMIVVEMLTIIFDTMNKSIASLYVFDWNSNAIQCYKKMGFTENLADIKIREVNGKTWRAINMQLHANDYRASYIKK
jgi:RimJ/RimL family protein N-acetyltransferase